jgi:integrase
MCTYLDQRGSTYYFRRVVPASLRPYLGGRSEWMRSLRTKDRAEAKRRIPAITIETDALMASAMRLLEAGTPLDERQVPTQWAGPTQRDLEQVAWEAGQDDMREARREQLEPAIEYLEERLRGSTREMPPELRAMKFLMDDVALSNRVMREQLAIARSLLKASAKPSDAAPTAPTPDAPAIAAVPMLPTFDAYAKAQGMTPGVAKEWRANMVRLVAFMGHNDLARLTADDLLRWRDALLTDVSKKGALRDPVTVKGKYIGAVKAMLKWVVEERKLPTNVATGVTVRVPRKAKLRERDFTANEARSILTASLVPLSSQAARTTALARRWIPWLCAYTGARVNEMSQLRGADVQEIDGVWTVRITPEAGTVKAKEARLVPLHPHLVEQGFPAIAKANGDGPIFFDPTRQRVQSTDNRHSKKVGEKLAQWVRKDVGVSDPAVKPNHGWRHTFKTICLEAGIEERAADYMQGHASKGVGRSYGSNTVPALARQLALFPRFPVATPPA